MTGVFGGMIMARVQLDIGFHEFIDRFGRELHGPSLLIGVGKAWVFAMIVAIIGCFQGFRTRGSADSVGRQTTLSVVQSIFLVIVADALFSVVFSMLELVDVSRAHDTVIRMRKVCTRFGSHVVHQDLDLEVRRGEVFAIVGGSGSGKTVLLREMILLQRPSSGTIEMLGADIATLDREAGARAAQALGRDVPARRPVQLAHRARERRPAAARAQHARRRADRRHRRLEALARPAWPPRPG